MAAQCVVKPWVSKKEDGEFKLGGELGGDHDADGLRVGERCSAILSFMNVFL
jgi:hypothetical protein